MPSSAGYLVPSGYRASTARPIAAGEVVASTYQIRDEIARTDHGVVYEARDMMLDRAVAFILAWRDPGTPSLITEARRCAAVRDPCAAAVHGMGVHQGVEYLVGERVTGTLLRDLLAKPLPADLYLARLRTLVAAVTRAHEAGIAVGEVSGSTVLVCDEGRCVLGRLSLSQVPALGPHGVTLAPEVARGDVVGTDPAAAEMIDLYGLGCAAIELACGAPPFADDDAQVELRAHAEQPPPRLADLRGDLPTEASDLVEWLLAKQPAARPRSARDVLAQLDAVIDRLGTATRSVRVLIVDDDTARARWLWSLCRRAHPAVIVEIASEGTDAAHKLNRDHPDLVLIDATLRGVMNALELCMYARGLPGGAHCELAAIGAAPPRDRALFDTARVPFIADDSQLAGAILDRVRLLATAAPRRRGKPSTISG